jgi:hypothetical protein
MLDEPMITLTQEEEKMAQAYCAKILVCYKCLPVYARYPYVVLAYRAKLAEIQDEKDRNTPTH